MRLLPRGSSALSSATAAAPLLLAGLSSLWPVSHPSSLSDSDRTPRCRLLLVDLRGSGTTSTTDVAAHRATDEAVVDTGCGLAVTRVLQVKFPLDVAATGQRFEELEAQVSRRGVRRHARFHQNATQVGGCAGRARVSAAAAAFDSRGIRRVITRRRPQLAAHRAARPAAAAQNRPQQAAAAQTHTHTAGTAQRSAAA